MSVEFKARACNTLAFRAVARSATAAAAARRRRATPTGGAVTLPRSTPAHGGQGGRHGARAGGWD